MLAAVKGVIKGNVVFVEGYMQEMRANDRI